MENGTLTIDEQRRWRPDLDQADGPCDRFHTAFAEMLEREFRELPKFYPHVLRDDHAFAETASVLRGRLHQIADSYVDDYWNDMRRQALEGGRKAGRR